jgi:hypothetical protein
MGLKDWFSRKSRLQLALERGRQPGESLSVELAGICSYSVKSAADAEAICGLLEQLLQENSASGGWDLRATMELFENVADTECSAYAVLSERGISLLVHFVDSVLNSSADHDAGDVLTAIKILVIYGTEQSTDAVVRAAQKPIDPSSYKWGELLRLYTEDHPEREQLYRALSDPLPRDFLAVALLDSATAAHLRGVKEPHPFDSAAGVKQLRDWLTDVGEDLFSYAVSATSTLAFITHDERDALLTLAFKHPSREVQLEAAWVAVRLGHSAGIKLLVDACLDPNYSNKAQQYLTELGHREAIPAGLDHPDFHAKARFSQYLANPRQLDRAPDELEIVDHRELYWPPAGKLKQLWLMRYRIKRQKARLDDTVGIGIYGSITSNRFDDQLERFAPEDAYAVHCYSELVYSKLIVDLNVPDGSTEYNQLLDQYQLDGISQTQIIQVAELSPKLRYPQSLVALAKAVRSNENGWIVLDGPRSRWYSASEMPVGREDRMVLMIHVGRVLLGFGA